MAGAWRPCLHWRGLCATPCCPFRGWLPSLPTATAGTVTAWLRTPAHQDRKPIESRAAPNMTSSDRLAKRDRPMRIAYFSDHFYPELGGIQDSIECLARGLAA